MKLPWQRPMPGRRKRNGVDDEGFSRKMEAVERRLTINQPNPDDSIDVLAKLDSFEIGSIGCATLAAAATIESVAESASDGIMAPLLTYAVADLPGALACRFANTADSM